MTEQLSKLVMVLSAQIQKMRSRTDTINDALRRVLSVGTLRKECLCDSYSSRRTSSLPNLLQDTMLQGAINFRPREKPAVVASVFRRHRSQN